MHFPQYKIISFYRYALVEDPPALREEVRALCQKHQLTGRILIATEGINGAVSGKKEDTEEFKKNLYSKESYGNFFSGLTFREQDAAERAHPKLAVKVRKEIVHFGREVDFKNKGTFLTPEELQRWYEQESFLSENSYQDTSSWVIVDARNDYEWKMGKFKNAITLPLKNFREFPEQAKVLEKYKDKKIVLYCTGGIRCEKASAYLQGQGFSQVYQIEGGIINYLHFAKHFFQKNLWEGGLFVFDGRLVSATGNPITACVHCGNASEEYSNCFNLDCDKLFVGCRDCLQDMNRTCSEECKKSPRQRKTKKKDAAREIIGRVENYYAKNKVALVRVQMRFKEGMAVTFSGMTTRIFTQKITGLRSEEGKGIHSAVIGELVTFPVEGKVRKGDFVSSTFSE